MSKKAFEKIAAGLGAAIEFAEGTADLSEYRIHVPPEIDVKSLRRGLGVTQKAFASRFGFNLARVRDWEQNRSRPDGAMRAYLTVIQREVKAVERALSAA